MNPATYTVQVPTVKQSILNNFHT